MLGFEGPELAGVLSAVSVATERIVEMLKGFLPERLSSKLNKPANPGAAGGSASSRSQDPNAEARRRALNHLVALVVGFALLWLLWLGAPSSDEAASAARGAGSDLLKDTGSLFLMALLASGGSGVWNGIVDLIAKLSKPSR